MIYKKIGIMFIVFAVGFSGPIQVASAAKLTYSSSADNQQAGNGEEANVGSGALPTIPVGYGSTDGNSDSYQSFLQSPYSNGPVSQEYAASSSQSPASPVVVQNKDSFFVSEVAPQYSPFFEVVGEGSDYTLGIDDVVTVMVRNQPDFSGRFEVDPNGNIQYNYVGDVKAEGMTKGELKAELTERLKKFVRYPEVAIVISEYKSKSVFVFGYVNRPGKYAMKGNKITVKEAVVAAGLLRDDGSMNNVYVVRPSQYTKNGKAEKRKVNLKELIVKGNSAEDFLLQPGDTIVVHQKYFDRFINAFSKVVGPVFQSAAVYELGFGSSKHGIIGGD